MVVRHPRLQPPAPERGRECAARAHGARDVRRAHARARDRARRAAVPAHAACRTCSSATRARSASRSRSRWRCSSGRARGARRSAACSRCAAGITATRSARWRSAIPRPGCTRCFARCCRSTCSRRCRRCRFDAAWDERATDELERLIAAHAGRARRGDPRADRAGRGRDALLSPALPAARARAVRRARRAADRRRDRDRLRPHRDRCSRASTRR